MLVIFKSLYSPSQKEVQRTQEGSYNVTRNLGDDGSYNMTLDISEFYSTTGVQKTIYIRVTEGDGSRYVLNELILINLRPFQPCELDPTLSECTGSESGGINPLFIGIGGFIAILAIVGVTLVARGRGGKDTDNDTVEQFGGVEQMDPVEAYVQQMVASGYDEQTARQYAEQYYASYYAQQKGGN